MEGIGYKGFDTEQDSSPDLWI